MFANPLQPFDVLHSLIRPDLVWVLFCDPMHVRNANVAQSFWHADANILIEEQLHAASQNLFTTSISAISIP